MLSDKRLLIESHYLPSVEYIALLSRYGDVSLEVNENFQKQTYRNRCQILGSNKVIKLVVPVKKETDRRMKVLRIDYRQDWLKDHWRSIESSYNNSPFFIYYRDELFSILNHKYDRLVDLNMALLTFCLERLNYNIKFSQTSEYDKNPSREVWDDFRDRILAKRDFRERGIIREIPYYQMFGKTFVPNLSILDLLFCEGPVSSEIIRKSLNK